MTDNATHIVCEGLSYRYPGGDEDAVHQVSFEVQPGTVAALVGPSGCGKSTMLRNVAGLLTPTAGRLLMDDNDTVGVSADKRNVGWVPQSYALFGHLSVAENVEFGLRARKVPKSRRVRRVAEALELCRIGDYAARRPDDLSGGQRQRVAIARALATDPRVLLLDEPLSALDPQLRKQLRSDLSTLLTESGVTTLLVTHDQGEALAMADMVAVMREGRLEQFASPEELWRAPANSFVAEFVSEAHVVTVSRTDDGECELAPGLRLPKPVGTSAVALRPSDLVLSDQGAPFAVEAVEYGGDAWLASGSLSNGAKVSMRCARRVRVGETVTVGINPSSVVSGVEA